MARLSHLQGRQLLDHPVHLAHHAVSSLLQHLQPTHAVLQLDLQLAQLRMRPLQLALRHRPAALDVLQHRR